MPHYYFDVHGGRAEEDQLGVILPHLDAAKLEALRLAAEIMKEQPLEPGDRRSLRVEIRQHGGGVLSHVEVTARMTHLAQTPPAETEEEGSEISGAVANVVWLRTAR